VSNLAMLIQQHTTPARGQATERQRDELYENFEGSIRAVQRQTEFQNELLQQKMKSIEEDVSRATQQVQEVSPHFATSDTFCSTWIALCSHPGCTFSFTLGS
jgi:hypothetical protein